MPDSRVNAGQWKPGQSGNPGGKTSGEQRRINRARKAAQKLSLKAVSTLETLLADESGKVAATAALGILKVAGVLNEARAMDDAKIEAEVERRLRLILDAEEARQPPKLAAVGGNGR